MQQVVGIDWATKPKNRALVALGVSDDGHCVVNDVKLTVTSEYAGDVCSASDNAVVAIDTPFGWPREFVSFVAKWEPTTALTGPPPADKFRLRLTDRVVRNEVPKQPLSVSSNFIAMGARAWAELVAGRKLAAKTDVEGVLRGPTTIIEVYPGASLIALDRGRVAAVGEKSYKQDASTRRSILRHVASTLALDLAGHEDEIAGKGNNSDATDAFIAAVTAALYLRDRTGRVTSQWRVRCPTQDEIVDARMEGWIFFPTPHVVVRE